MTEIKFRLWHRELHTMAVEGTFKNIVLAKQQPPSLEDDWDNGLLEWMRGTGLKDMHGKEIYFGDIVKFSWHDEDCPEENYGGTAAVVETLNGGAGILSDWKIETEPKYAVTNGGIIEDLWEDEEWWTIEVIGNIYENPELLKNDPQ